MNIAVRQFAIDYYLVSILIFGYHQACTYLLDLHHVEMKSPFCNMYCQ